MVVNTPNQYLEGLLGIPQSEGDHHLPFLLEKHPCFGFISSLQPLPDILPDGRRGADALHLRPQPELWRHPRPRRGQRRHDLDLRTPAADLPLARRQQLPLLRRGEALLLLRDVCWPRRRRGGLLLCSDGHFHS